MTTLVPEYLNVALKVEPRRRGVEEGWEKEKNPSFRPKYFKQCRYPKVPKQLLRERVDQYVAILS